MLCTQKRLEMVRKVSRVSRGKLDRKVRPVLKVFWVKQELKVILARKEFREKQERKVFKERLDHKDFKVSREFQVKMVRMVRMDFYPMVQQSAIQPFGMALSGSLMTIIYLTLVEILVLELTLLLQNLKFPVVT